MRARVAIIAVCVCLGACVALALAQQPAPPTSDPRYSDNPIYPSGKDNNYSILKEDESRIKQRNEQISARKAAEQEAERGKVQKELLLRWKVAGNDPERGKVGEELHKVLLEQFQDRLGEQEKEIEQLELKVKRLREQLELRRKKQDEIVDFRLQQLLREAEGLGWGTEDATPRDRYNPAPPSALPSPYPSDPFGNGRK